MEKDQFKIIVWLIVGQIAVTVLGVWYVSTYTDRKLKEDCSESINKNAASIMFNVENKEEHFSFLLKDCVSKGGSNNWQGINHAMKDLQDIKDKLKI